MDKNTLIRVVSKHSDRTQKQLREDLNYFLDQIAEALSRGETVKLPGFGVFSVKMKKQKTGYDVFRLSPMVIPEGRYIRFDASQIIKDRIAGANVTSQEPLMIEKEAMPVP